MKTDMDIKQEDLKIINSILKEHIPQDAKIWVFGSRARGDAKPFSDLDLALDFNRKMTLEELAVLNTAFENSLLPYKVDLVDLHVIDHSFRKIIDNEKQDLIN